MRRTAPNALGKLPHYKADFIEPMDCAPVSKLPDGPQWLFEIKLDGYRAVAVKSDRRVDVFSRRHKSFNHQYPHVVEALGEPPEGTIVDGEVVALDESGPPHGRLRPNALPARSFEHLRTRQATCCQVVGITTVG